MPELTWEDLRAVFPEGYKPVNKSIDGDLLWWYAYKVAVDLIDLNTAKDWAYFVLEGYPSLEKEDVLQALNEEIEECEGELDRNQFENELTPEQAREGIIKRIKAFYEVGT